MVFTFGGVVGYLPHILWIGWMMWHHGEVTVLSFEGYLTQWPPLKKLKAYFILFCHFGSSFSICGQNSNQFG
jgi:hypothetical protein